MKNTTEKQQLQPPDFISYHPFKKLEDIDLNGNHNDLYGPSSSRTATIASSSRSSSSCSSSSKQTKMAPAAAAAAYEQQRHSKAPRVNIMIDQQPDYIEKGKSIFGRLYIDTNGVPSTTRVKNLRVSVFGNARVHGDQPDQPFSQGLFDYKKDVKLLSTGVRIVKRGVESNSEQLGLSPFLTSDEQKEQQQKVPARKRSKDKGRMIDPDDFDIHAAIHHDEEQEGVVHSGENNNNNGDWFQGINNNNTSSSNKMKSPSSFKQARDKAIEQLMERIALCAPSSESASSHGMSLQILNAPQTDQEEEEKSYDLEPNKNHRIRFSIPITTRRLLPGSLEHNNHPIRYHIVALLIYTTDSHPNASSVSHIVVPLTFQPTPIATFKDTDEELITARQKTNPVSIWITNSKLDQILLSVKTKQAVKTMPPPPSSPTSLTAEQNAGSFSRNENSRNNNNNNSSSLIVRDNNTTTTWMARLLYHLSHYYVQRRRVLTTPHLKCSLELPHKTFSQGDAIPLRVHVENTGLDISQVIIETKLKKRLYMTYHCGELAESKLIDQATTLFTANDPIQLIPVSATSNNNNNDQISIRSTARDSGMGLKCDGGSDDSNTTTPSNLSPVVAVESSSLCYSRNIVFDLTKVLYVSDQCSHTVLPEMTKDTFEISYELQVAVSVLGSRIISTTHEETNQSFFYASADQHFSRSSITRNKGYLLKPPSIPIMIGSQPKLI
ncbi:hypothetical protein BDA99DRAFT_506636 [Phascolomyces articulosus]|uniref:Arrestin C-terminal-like domain-containing protein n=1 Tax=Phascolomyces articulosus TaxID=60185 RepID=A0AAD5K2V2_9FUNG|nr:hypothetical protein BDA99DRAFT_506636 [Phascolomyces articulosus]